jgi:N-acyl homoserine lactone hydrolase
MGLEIHPMCLGEIVVDGSFLVWGWNHGQPYRIPFTSYLILGGDHPIMVDAGARSVADINRDMGLETGQSDDQTLEANLARHGLVPRDIGTLILTHLHVDHTGLVDQLPNARVRLQRTELQYAAAPHFPPGFFDRIDIAKLVGPLYGQLDFDEGDAEIAPGVRVLLTGGHSPGHQMVYVDVDSGQAIITGDNVYRKDPALAMQFPPGLVHDLADAMRAVAKITREGKHVLPMHDPVVYDEYPDGVR